jgi:hypothetical protein
MMNKENRIIYSFDISNLCVYNLQLGSIEVRDNINNVSGDGNEFEIELENNCASY